MKDPLKRREPGFRPIPSAPKYPRANWLLGSQWRGQQREDTHQWAAEGAVRTRRRSRSTASCPRTARAPRTPCAGASGSSSCTENKNTLRVEHVRHSAEIPLGTPHEKCHALGVVRFCCGRVLGPKGWNTNSQELLSAKTSAWPETTRVPCLPYK